MILESTWSTLGMFMELFVLLEGFQVRCKNAPYLFLITGAIYSFPFLSGMVFGTFLDLSVSLSKLSLES